MKIKLISSHVFSSQELNLHVVADQANQELFDDERLVRTSLTVGNLSFIKRSISIPSIGKEN